MKYDFYIRTRQDLLDAVEEYGIVPYFSNSIPGFSLEEHCAPSSFWSDDGEDAWAWKGPVIRESGCAYGKFFEKKAAYVSRKWFLELANYRRDGYDFDARVDEGLVKRADQELYELIESQAPVLSKTLRASGSYAYSGRFGKTEGKKGFDGTVTRLQEQCYVLISDFVYALDKHGRPHGWGVAEYSTPEKQMGAAFTEKVYLRSPEESCALLLDHLRTLFPQAEEKALRRFLK